MAASTDLALVVSVDNDAEEVGRTRRLPARKALAQQFGGVLDGEAPRTDADERCRDPLELPGGRLLPRRAEGATDHLAAARAIGILEHEVHDQRRREVAAAGHHRGTRVER